MVGVGSHRCNYMYTIHNIAWYSVVTLRDACLEYHLKGLRQYYPNIVHYTIDNNAGHYNINPIAEKYQSIVLTNETILPLTVNQNIWSKELFKKHSILCFSADDILILDKGFIELGLDKINQGAEIVSFSTNVDAIAFMYTENYFNNVGFNTGMPGKEMTNLDLQLRVEKAYKNFPQIGEYWKEYEDGWRSKYVGNPHVGKFEKDDVNFKLKKLNIKF